MAVWLPWKIVALFPFCDDFWWVKIEIFSCVHRLLSLDSVVGLRIYPFSFTISLFRGCLGQVLEKSANWPQHTGYNICEPLGKFQRFRFTLITSLAECFVRMKNLIVLLWILQYWNRIFFISQAGVWCSSWYLYETCLWVWYLPVRWSRKRLIWGLCLCWTGRHENNFEEENKQLLAFGIKNCTF